MKFLPIIVIAVAPVLLVHATRGNEGPQERSRNELHDGIIAPNVQPRADGGPSNQGNAGGNTEKTEERELKCCREIKIQQPESTAEPNSVTPGPPYSGRVQQKKFAFSISLITKGKCPDFSETQLDKQFVEDAGDLAKQPQIYNILADSVPRRLNKLQRVAIVKGVDLENGQKMEDLGIEECKNAKDYFIPDEDDGESQEQSNSAKNGRNPAGNARSKREI